MSSCTLLLHFLVTVLYRRHQIHLVALLLDVVVCKGEFVLKLLPCVDETLLVGWDALPVLDLQLHFPDSVLGGKHKGDCLPIQGLDEDLHAL